MPLGTSANFKSLAGLGRFRAEAQGFEFSGFYLEGFRVRVTPRGYYGLWGFRVQGLGLGG